MELTENDQKVLEYLKGLSESISIKELSEPVEILYTNLSTIINRLYYAGYIKRVPSSGRGYKYRFFTDTNPTPVPRPVPKVRVPKEGIRRKSPVDAESLYGLLSKWAQEPWRPKIFDSATRLPVGLARLYLMAVDGRYGSPVDPNTLLSIKESILEFHRDLQNTINVVTSILEVSYLWDPIQLPFYLTVTSQSDNVPDLQAMKTLSEKILGITDSIQREFTIPEDESDMLE